MGEQIKLLCCETRPNNNGKDLKEIFINRFKLPDDFWSNLFDTNCPEGLGKVNEKLRNNEDLSASDFKSRPDDSLIHEDGQHGNNKLSILQVKTPTSVVESLSNTNCSQSLFSPLSQDLQKGPSSSTPLPGKTVCVATFTITPKTTKNNAQNDYSTPKHKLLGCMPYNTKAKSQKLSASLAMDPLEQMNLSWSSSLATPPVSGRSNQVSVNTKNDQSTPGKIYSSELGETQLDELDTIRIENPLEQLNTIKVESKSKPMSKGVARILFEKEMNRVDPCKISKVNEAEKLKSQTSQFKSVSDDSGKKKLCEVSAADNHSVNYFDMSCLSPLQETVITELFMMVDTRKSPKEIKSIGLIETSVDTIEEKSTPKKAFDIASKHVENSVTKHPDCINEHAIESSEINPNGRNITRENADKDFRNIDMDALSEFPMDFDLSQLITVQSTSNQGQTINPEDKNGNNDNNALTTNMSPDLVRDEKTEAALKSNVEGAVCLTDKVNKPPEELDNLYDMDALSELPIDFDISRYITDPILHPDNNDCYNESHCVKNISTSDSNGVKGQDIDGNKNVLTGKVNKPPGEVDSVYDMDAFSEPPSLHSDNNDCNNDFHCFTNKSNSDSDGKCIGQNETSEGQMGENEKSKIIQSPKHAEQNALTRKDEVRKTLYDEQNDKLKIVSCPDVEKYQDGKSLNPFLGFSTASGKKVTISDKSIQRARQFLSEVNMEEKKFSSIGKTINGNFVVRRNLADCIGTYQVNKPKEKLVNTGFSTASGKKVDVSMRSLNKARQIVQDVMQEESEESKDVKKSVVADEGVTLTLKTKFEEPKLMSDNDKIGEKERDEFTPDRQMRRHFDTENGFPSSITALNKESRISEKPLAEFKSILGEFELIPELSEDFLKDVDKVFADLDEKPCLSKRNKTHGDMTKVKLNKGEDLDIAKRIPSANNECRERICRMEMPLSLKDVNHRFLSLHGKKDVLTDESLNKSPVDSELDGKQFNDGPDNLNKNQLEEQQKSVTKEPCNEHAAGKNLFQLKPNVVSTASDNITERGEGKEVVKNNLPESKTTVLKRGGVITSYDSLHEDKLIMNKLCKPNCQEMNGLLKINKKPFDVGTNVTNSQGILSGKENEDCSKKTRKLCNIQNIEFSTLSGNEIIDSEASRKPQTFSNEECREEQSQEKVAKDKYNELRRACFNTSASGNNTIISETVIQPTKMLYNDENEKCSRVAVGTFEFQKRGNENVDLSISSDETDTVIMATNANENQGNSRSGKSFNKFPNFGFSTASGTKITVSEESLKKAQIILHEVENDGHQSKRTVVDAKHNNPCSIGCLKNKSAGFTTASGKNVAISEVSLQKARKFLNNKENVDCSKGETTTSRIPMFGFSVSKESLTKARRILNEVGSERQTNGGETNEKCKSPCSTTAVKDKPFSFSTVSANSVTVSGVSIQKPNCFVTDKKNDNCSEKGNYFNKSPKLCFSTAAGKEIAVSEESMKKARRILNEVDDEGHRSEIKTVNEQYDNPCSTTSTTKASVGFTTASGNNVTVSEASMQKAKRMLDDKLHEEEKSSRAVSKFGFSTASGNKITISEESLNKARKILKEAANEEPKVNYRIGKLAVGTSKKNTENYQMAENVVDDAKCVEHKVDVRRPPSTSPEDILKSGKSVCDKTRLPSKRKAVENGNDSKCQGSHIKRLSSEIETENDRACKASRTGKETRNGGRKWMRFKRFDPLVTSKDRMRSGNPSQVVMVSPSLENNNQVALCDKPVDVKTPINVNSKAKPCSHFTTPYRVTIMEQGKSSEKTAISKNANTPLSSCSKLGEKKTKSADQKKKNHLVKPQPGSIYKLRTNSCLKSRRISFAEYVSRVNQQNFRESEIHDVRSSFISISCENAESYRFEGSDFLSDDIFATNGGVTLTEGAVLFLGEDKCAGLPEVTKAFLSSPGVDPKFISEKWIANHYKWIVWKLASYERSYPQTFSGRALTPDVVLSQLKYRYDREIDHCERSAIKKILERDDSASRSMVLCVASLNVKAFDKNNESANDENQRKNVPPQKVILMTDNWYEIRVLLDEYLENLVREKKIYVGQKLYIQCAELCGSDQPVSPLEAPSNLYLRIHGNSTRPAKKFSRLGFHCKNNVFLVPIKSISTVGGLVSCINVIAVRQYPLQFMEKLPDGKCIFRNPRCEERVAKKFEDDVQRKREKIIAQVQKEIDEEETKTTRRKTNSLSTDQILSLSDGKQIFDAISNADDPFGVQKCLSDEQRRLLHNYKENLHNDRADIVRRRCEKAWSKLSEDETLKRDVVPILKVKLVDCFPPKSNQTPGTALLTVWRPNEQTITTLGEGKRLKIYNLQVSKYKGNSLVQLSANRATIYRSINASSTDQKPFEARKEFTLREISNGLKPNVEVDVVAVVISQSCQHNLTLVYVADFDLNLLRIKVWGGLENLGKRRLCSLIHVIWSTVGILFCMSQGLQDVMKEKNFIAACNLLSQPDKRSGIPSVKYYELSLVTSNPSNKKLRNSLHELRKAVPNADSFTTKAKAKLDVLCRSSWSTPQGQNVTPMHGTSSESAGKRRRTMDTLVQTDVSTQKLEKTPLSSTIKPRQNVSGLLESRKRILYSKRRKLDLLADPSPISAIPNALPASVRKAFQVPRRIRTQADDTENEEE